MKSIKTRGIVAVTMVAAMAMATPAVAFADSSTTTTSTTTTTTVKAHQNVAWQQWRTAHDAYVDQLKVINKTFRATVVTARHAYWAALKASKGSNNRAAARISARAALTLSIANAMNARATALTALGAPPVPPVGSARSVYIVALEGINQTYRTASIAAYSTFAAAFVLTTTPAERATVRAQLELSIANAAVARAAALVALGAAPTSNSATTTTTVPVTTATA